MANIPKPLTLSSDTLKAMQSEEKENLYEQYCDYFKNKGIESDEVFCFAQLAVIIAFGECFKSKNQ